MKNNMLKSKCASCVFFICILAVYLSSADDSISPRPLCYFTAYLDAAAGSSCYFYFVKIGQMTGDGQLILDGEGRPSELDITSFKLGKSFSVQGRIGLSDSHPLDLTADIERLDLSTFLQSFLSDAVNLSATGFIEGKIKINGKIDIPRITGRLKSRSLKVGDVDYHFSYVDLNGTWPFVFIEDGMIFYEGGYFAISGYIDLADLPNSSAWNNIVCKSDEKNLRWRGWDISKGASGSFGYADGLSLKREQSDEIRVSLKKFMNNEASTENMKDDEIALEYKMGNKNIKMRLRDRDEFLGMEHSLKF